MRPLVTIYSGLIDESGRFENQEDSATNQALLARKQQANNTQQIPQQQQNNQNYNQTQQPNQNVKLPKNTEIDDQYIHGEVAEALQRKTEIERQASEDYENGLISEDEAMERDEQASEILNQAVENQYGSQD